MVIKICSACNGLIFPGQQAESTKGRNRLPIKMHATCWAKKKSLLNDPVHVSMSRYYRDNNIPCITCGSTDDIQADHIVSRENGGLSVRENYQPLCKPCNIAKG